MKKITAFAFMLSFVLHAQTKANPGANIKWPDNCSAPGMVYVHSAKSCMLIGNAPRFPGVVTDGNNGIKVNGAVSVGASLLLDSSSYVSFAAACSDAVSKKAVLLVSLQYAAMTTQSCAANLRFDIGAGAPPLQPASGQTITLSGNIEAPLAQVFDISAGGGFVLNKAPVVYPEWFGATGDGAAADGPAVQAAISSTSKRIWLGGTYKIAAQLYVLVAQAGLLIDGPGKITTGTSLTRYGPTSSIGNNSAIIVYHAANVTIRDITVDETNLSASSTDGIEFFRSVNGTVQNTKVLYSSMDGIHFYDAVHNALIRGNYVIGSKGDGILWHSRSQKAVITDNIVLDTTVVPIEVEGRIGSDDLNLQPNIDATISNNVIKNTTLTNQGILVDWSSNIAITGNALTNVQGIELLGVTTAVVTTNTFVNCPNFVIVTPETYTHSATSSDIIISGNSGTLGTYPAVPRFDGVFVVDSANNVQVSNNRASTTDFSSASVFFRRGTTLSTPVNIRLSGNRVNGGFATFAANVNNMAITNNRIGIRYGAAAMTFPAGALSNIVFTGNVVDNMNTLQLANASSTVTNLNISGNIFKALSQSIGIYTPATATLVRCIISGNRFYDITLTPIALSGATAGVDTIVSNNIAKGSSLSGSTVTSVGNAF